MNLFGKKKNAGPAAPTQTPIETIANLKKHLETVEKREAHIYKKIDMAIEEAKNKLTNKDKRGSWKCVHNFKLRVTNVSHNRGDV